MKDSSPSISLANRHLTQYAREVSEEQWKLDHDRASQVWGFEHFLRNGIWLFDSVIALDEAFRRQAREVDAEEVNEFREQCLGLVRQWLAPCEHVENVLQAFIREGYDVEGAKAFRNRYAEARWMLAKATDLFNQDVFVELQDAAIDALRAGDVEPACNEQ